MPSYPYQCASCGHELEETYPIGTAVAMRTCPTCGGVMRRVLGRGLYIGADALPNKRHGVRATDATERQWGQDMPAYRRMRDRGLQPQSIDGAARLEGRVDDQMDIQYRTFEARPVHDPNTAMDLSDRQQETLRKHLTEVTESLTGELPARKTG